LKKDEESLLDILMNDESELRKPLTIIQEELATHIGPVAELVFIDSLNEWRDAPPSLETIPELLDILVKEIDDDNGRILFRDNLKLLVGETE